MADVIDRRILGAVRFLDRAAGYMLERPLKVVSEQAEFVRNRSNHYVVTRAPGLDDYVNTFRPTPTTPAPLTALVSAVVDDPLQQYLPRSFSMQLPRDPDPNNAGGPGSAFRAVDAKLYAASRMPIRGNWSTIRASIMQRDTSDAVAPVRGALLRVIRVSDDQVLASGISDERGEALVIVPGVPVTQFADDNGGDDAPVVVAELPVRLELSVSAESNWPVDPDLLEINHAASIRATGESALRTGRMNRVVIELTP